MLSSATQRCLHTSRRRSAIMMPAMSPLMTQGTVTRWFKKEGEAFNQGDFLLEIESDIARINVEALNPGILGKILIPAGSRNIPVEQVLALVAKDQEELVLLRAAHAQAAPPKLRIQTRVHTRSQSLREPVSASPSAYIPSQPLLPSQTRFPPTQPPRPRSPNLPSLSLLTNSTAGVGQISQHVRGLYSASSAQPSHASTFNTRRAEASSDVQSSAATVRRKIVSKLNPCSNAFDSLL